MGDEDPWWEGMSMDDLIGWEQTDDACPECGAWDWWKGSWWDDHPEAGGACIGTRYECRSCGYWDSH